MSKISISFKRANEAMLREVVKAINAKTKAACTGCGKCEKHYPQHIPIRDELQTAQKELEGPLYRTLRKSSTGL